MNDNKFGRNFQGHVGHDEGVVVETGSVHHVGQGDEGNILHVTGRVVEGVPEAFNGLLSVAWKHADVITEKLTEKSPFLNQVRT